MDSDTIIGLINPMIGAIVAASYFGLWAYMGRHYVGQIALAYVCLAMGFLVQFWAPMPMVAERFVSNGLFVAGSVCFAFGLFGRYGRPMPWRILAIIVVCGAATFSFFLVVAPDINYRIFVINLIFGSICIMMAREIGKAEGRRTMDDVLLWTLRLSGALFFVRPFVTFWFAGPLDGTDGFDGSAYWMSTVLSGSAFMLVFALAIGAAIVGDLLDELTRASETDPLSGLLNRRGFEMRMEKRLAELAAMGMPAALIACDIDHFKRVNDRFGHACGDLVIERFADCLRSASEEQHLVGRMGGEEFAILLEHADARTAALFAEGLRITFASAAVDGLPRAQRFSASFGVAEAAAVEPSSQLFRRADQALYRAKNGGRDCVRVAPSATADACAEEAGTGMASSA